MTLTLKEAIYSRSWLVSSILDIDIGCEVTEENLQKLLQLVWLLWLVTNTGMGIFEAIVITGETVDLPQALLYHIQDREEYIQEWVGRFSPDGTIGYIIEL